MDVQHTPLDTPEAPPPSADNSGAQLAGLLSLLGSAPEPEKADGDQAAALLRALRPYLRSAQVFDAERMAQLLETARSIRGLLHSFSPLLGDLLGGKN